MNRRALLRAAGAAGLGLTFGQSGAAASLDSYRSPESYAPLGRVDVTGAAEAVVGDGGQTAYLATADGFATVDVTDPADPTVLAERHPLEVDDRPFTDILDVKVDGDRLAVVGPANETDGDAFHGFVLYDVSDPADPVRVGEPYETGFHVHNCFLTDDWLYVVANGEAENPLEIYDVAGDEPTAVGRWSLLELEPDWADVYWLARYLHDVYVHDEIAYLAHWNAGTYLLDVSEVADPTYISHVSETAPTDHEGLEDREAQLGLPGNDHYAAVDETGDLLAVGREAWATGGDAPDGPGGIDLYDVSDPAAPTHRGSIDAPEADDASYHGGEWTTAHNFDLRDGRLYASWYQGGVSIHDVSDPATPVERARWREPETAGFWTARVATDEFVVASSTPLIRNADTEGALYTFPTDPEASSSGLLESVPGFTGVAGLAGGALALEWLRRRRREAEQ